MKLSFLSADVALVKSFTLSEGALVKSPYPNAFLFTSHTEDINTLDELYVSLNKHSAVGHCLLKGTLGRDLVNESRSGSTYTEAPTSYICFDVDGLQGVETPAEFMALIGFSDVSHIVQYSASMGIEGAGKGLRCHIFALLSQPLAPPMLKQWLMSLNLGISKLRSEISLTRTGTSLRWPLDITTCQNDKLLYIAPPKLGKGVKDTFKGKRIQLVRNKLDSIPAQEIQCDVNKVRTAQKLVLNELRKKADLPPIRETAYKTEGSISYISKPGEAVITGVKNERGFVYFNLNGGDSWAYYHPENKPEFIMNFKGEPAYKTEELLPDYWRALHQVRADSGGDSGREYFAIRDFATDRLFNGYYDRDTQELVIARTATEGRLRSFLKQHGQPVPDFVPDWSLTYNPASNVRYDPENKVINLFNPSAFTKLKLRKVDKLPPITNKILESAVGTGATKEHFLNWLACIVQFRIQTKTAWVLTGTQGTGKGLMLHKIITPMLGMSNVHSMLAETLESPFNGWMENKLLIFVDEVQISSLGKNSRATAALKNYIVEPFGSVRRLYSEACVIPYFANFIFASNQPDPVVVEHTDRRYNVGMFQNNRLAITDAELALIEDELEDVYMFFMSYKANKELAGTILDTEDRKLLKSINRTSVDEVADAILSGNLEWLLDQLPSSSDPVFQTVAAAAYNNLLKQLLVHGERWKSLTRDELRLIFDYCVGGMPQSPHKFTSLLKHHRIYTKKIRRDDKTPYGINLNWKHDTQWFEEMRQTHCPPAPVAKLRKTS